MDIDNYQSTSAEDLSRFAIGNGREIERILRGLMKDKALLTVQGSKSKQSFLTTILGLDDRARKLYIECAADRRAEGDLLGRTGIELIAHYEGVRVQFTIAQGERVKFDGLDAYKLSLPDKVYRFQRRQYYRVQTPQAQPVKCAIPLTDRALEATITDISVGGIGVRYEPGAAEISVGMELPGCRLSIPELDVYTITLKVRNSAQVTLKNGALVQRLGCEFVDVSVPLERAIQTYIFKLERERRSWDL